MQALRTEKVPVGSVLDDLLSVEPRGGDEPSALSEENLERIRYLFANDLYELPDSIRPLCHQGGHTYPSVYGRMRWDVPSATITSGFLSPGRGRFIHPRLPRTITLHEGARIQGFPDSFDFGFGRRIDIARSTLARMIADAVPPALGAIFGLAASSVARAVTPMVAAPDTVQEISASYVA
jgi:DNA (cytosine-5)-methyltransferase 1